MRGGTFDDDYKIEKEDFIKYIRKGKKEGYQEKRDVVK